MINHVRTDHRAFAIEKIQYARRHAGFFVNFHQHGTDDDRLLGRFHDHRVPRDERGADHATQDRHRKIPRRDDQRDAARPVMLIAFFAGHILREPRLTHQAHLPGVEGTKIDGFGNVAVRLSPWLTDLKDFERGKLKPAALENFSGAFQQLTAFFKRSATPFLECHPCSGDGAFSFGYASFGSVADDLVWLARIDRGKHVVGPNLFAVDRERNFARKLLALFAERSPHFFLVFGQREVR